MSSIDERIVEMQFNNKQFEAGVNTSINSIEKLKKSMDFDAQSKALDKLQNAGKSFNFGNLGSTVESIGAKFSAMEIAGMTAIMNITNTAVNYGKKTIKAMTVDPIMAGWNKLADKTTSVATLIAQGYDMSYVTEQLERLNWFTDETSYNFTEMVSSIAKFTASGQDLDSSVTALMGVANWAALSGQNATTASRAMYQLSQAMGAGYMRKEDYKSIQNVSMDTDEFRQKALEAGVAVGTLRDNLDGTYTSLVKNEGAFTKAQFSEHLTQDAWMTSEVMMKVFNDYSASVGQIMDYANEKGITASEAIEELGNNVDAFGLKAFKAAQEARTWTDVVDSVKDAVSTGWMNTFENIFGDYEEQRVLWTDMANTLYDLFAEAGNERNEILADWKELGGRTDLIEGIKNIFQSLSDVLGAIKQGFRDIFPGVTAKRLAEVTAKFREFTQGLRLNEETLNGVRKAVSLLMIPIKLLTQLVKPLVTVALTLVKVVFNLINNFDEIVAIVKEAVTENERLSEAFNKIKMKVQPLIDMFVSLKDAFVGFIQNFNGVDSIAELAAKIVTAFKTYIPQMIQSGANIVAGLVRGIISGIPQVVSNAVNLVKQFLTAFDQHMGIHSPAKTMILRGSLIIAGLIVGLLAGSKELRSTAKEFVGNLLDSIDSNIGPGLKDKIASIGETIKTAFETTLPKVVAWLQKFREELSLGKIAAVGFAAAIIAVVSSLAKAIGGVVSVLYGAANVLNNFGGLIGGVKSSLSAFTALIKKKAKFAALKNIAATIALLVGAMLILTQIKPEKLAAAASAVSVAAVGIAAALAVLTIGFSLVPTLADNLEKFGILAASLSTGLLLMAIAAKQLAGFTNTQYIASAQFLGVLLVTLAGVCILIGRFAGLGKSTIKGALTILAIASSIRIMITALQELTVYFLWLENITLDGDAVLNILKVFGLIALALAAVSIPLVAAGKHAIKAVVAIGLLVGLVALIINSLDLTDECFTRVMGISAIIAANDYALLKGFGLGFLALCTGLALAGKYALKAAVGIGALVGVLALLRKIFPDIKQITVDFSGLSEGMLKKVANVLIAFGVIMLAVAAINAISGGKMGNGIGSIAGLILALASLTGALFLLSEFTDMDKLVTTAHMLTLVMLAFTGMEAAASLGSKGLASVIALITTVMAITVALSVLQLFDTKGLIVAGSALTATLLAFALDLWAASKIIAKVSLVSIVLMIATLITITASLVVLYRASEGIDMGTLITIAASLAGVLTFMAVAAAIANNCVNGSAAMIIMAAATAIVAASLGAMAYYIEDPNAVIKIGATIAGVMLVLSTAALIANTSLVGAVAMTILAADAAIVAATLWGMATLIEDPKKMLNCALTLVGTLTALTLLGALATIATAGVVPLLGLTAALIGISAAIGIAAAAFTLFSVGCTILAKAIATVSPVLPMFAQGIKAMIEQTTSALVTAAENLVSAAGIIAYGIGSEIVAGLINGILDGIASVIATGLNLGGQLIEAIRVACGTHSDSWITHIVGNEVGGGLVNGIVEWFDKVKASGQGLGDSAISGLSEKIPAFGELGNMAGELFSGNFAGKLKDTLGIGNLFGGNSQYQLNQLKAAEEDAKRIRDLAKKDYDSGKASLDYYRKSARAYSDAMIARQEYESQMGESGGLLDGLKSSIEDLIPDMDDLTESMEGVTGAGENLNAGGGDGGGLDDASKKAGDTTEKMALLGRVIDQVSNDIKATNNTINDQKALDLATESTKRFAASLANITYEATETEDGLNSMLTALEDYRKGIADAIQSNVDFFSSLEATEVEIENPSKALSSRLTGIENFVSALDTISKKGLDQRIFDQIANMGVDQGLAYAQYYSNMTDVQIQAVNASADKLITATNDAADRIVAFAVENASKFEEKKNDRANIISSYIETLSDRIPDLSYVTDSVRKRVEEFAKTIQNESEVDFENIINFEDLIRAVENELSEADFSVIVTTIDNVTKNYSSMINGLADTDDMDHAKKSVYDFAKAIAKIDDASAATVEGLGQMRQAIKTYREDIASAIASNRSFFESFTASDQEIDSPFQVFASQKAALTQFSSYLTTLAQKGLDPEIYNSIIEMGVEQGLAYAAMYANMSAEQIAAVNNSKKELLTMEQDVTDQLLAAAAENYAVFNDPSLQKKNALAEYIRILQNAIPKLKQTDEEIATMVSDFVDKIQNESITDTTNIAGYARLVEALLEGSLTTDDEIVQRYLTNMRMAIDAANDLVDSDLDTDPVITPVLDTSLVKLGIEDIKTMFKEAGIKMGKEERAAVLSNKIKEAYENKRIQTVVENDKAAVASGNVSVVFNQTNTSPKALSQTEIYRQTGNILGRVVGNLVGVPSAITNIAIPGKK